MYIVYKHTFPNNKVYIGITCIGPSNRWRDGKGYYTQLVYRAILKYGWDNIKHEVLFENLTKEEAEKKEIELIAEYKSNQREFGYNVESGGNVKGKCSEETRKKMSENFKGSKNPMYGKGFYGTANPMYGKHWSDEQKKAHSQKMKGKLSGSKNPMYGKHWDEEHKKKLSENERGSRNPRARAVRCIDTDAIYSCGTIAQEKTGISRSSICQCCKGVTKTAGGFKWEYVTEFRQIIGGV